MDLRGVRKTIGTNIRGMRKEQNLTLGDLAKHLGVSYQQVQKYELGRNSVSAEKLVLIAKVFGCSMDRLCDLNSPGSHSIGAGILVSKFQRIESPELRGIASELLALFADWPEMKSQRNPESTPAGIDD